MAGKKKPKQESNVIAVNRKASHDYYIETRFESGIALEGWEVRSLREGRGQLVDSYVIIKHGEAFLLGALITPLLSASTHVQPDPSRTRKLLLHRDELKKLIGHIERKGYTVVPLKMYWKKSKVKVEIALARGKKDFDKRESTKQRDWERQKARIMSHKSN